MYSGIFLQLSIFLVIHVCVHSKPIANEINATQSWIIDRLTAAVMSDPILRKMESTSSEHAFIKLDAPKNHVEIPVSI